MWQTKHREKEQFGDAILMGTFTWSTGLGMLGVGIVVIAIIGAIFLYVIKHKKKEDKYGK